MFESIYKDTFKGLNKLKYLDLSDNEFKTFPSGLFWGLINLEHLDVSDNGISFLRTDLFKGLPKNCKIIQ